MINGFFNEQMSFEMCQCIGFIIFSAGGAVATSKDDNPKPLMEQKENKWVRKTAFILLLIFIVFIAVSVLTYKLDRDSCAYWTLIILHIVFMIIVVIMLIAIVISGITRDFGKYFHRKIVVYDP